MSQLMLVNPKKRRKTRRKTPGKSVARRRVSTRAVKKYRRRRNPIRRGGLMGIVTSSVIPAATAAIGAVGLDVIWGYAPIPTNLKTGPMKHVVKAAGAIGLGLLAGMVVNRKMADQMATGALTVVLHGAMTDGLARFAPNVKLGGYDEYDLGVYPDELGYTGSGQDAGMGVYLNTPSPMSEPEMGAYDYDELTL